MPASPDPDSFDDESRDPLWSLLGHARRANVPVDFPDRVVDGVNASPETIDRTPLPRAFPLSVPNHHTTMRQASMRYALTAAAALILMLGTVGWWTFRPLDLATSSSIPGATADPPVHSPAAPAADDADAIVHAIATELALLEHADFLLAPEDGLDLDELDLGQLF